MGAQHSQQHRVGEDGEYVENSEGEQGEGKSQEDADSFKSFTGEVEGEQSQKPSGKGLLKENASEEMLNALKDDSHVRHTSGVDNWMDNAEDGVKDADQMKTSSGKMHVEEKVSMKKEKGVFSQMEVKGNSRDEVKSSDRTEDGDLDVRDHDKVSMKKIGEMRTSFYNSLGDDDDDDDEPQDGHAMIQDGETLQDKDGKLMNQGKDGKLQGKDKQLTNQDKDAKLQGKDRQLTNQDKEGRLQGKDRQLMRQDNEGSRQGKDKQLMSQDKVGRLQGKDEQLMSKSKDGQLKSQDKDRTLQSKDEQLMSQDKMGRLQGKDEQLSKSKDGQLKSQDKDGTLQGKDEQLMSKSKDGQLKSQDKSGRLQGKDEQLMSKSKDGQLKSQGKDGTLQGKDEQLTHQDKEGRLQGKDRQLMRQDNEGSLQGKDKQLMSQGKDGTLQGKDEQLMSKSKDGQLKSQGKDGTLQGKDEQLMSKSKDGQLMSQDTDGKPQYKDRQLMSQAKNERLERTKIDSKDGDDSHSGSKTIVEKITAFFSSFDEKEKPKDQGKDVQLTSQEKTSSHEINAAEEEGAEREVVIQGSSVHTQVKGDQSWIQNSNEGLQGQGKSPKHGCQDPDGADGDHREHPSLPLNSTEEVFMAKKQSNVSSAAPGNNGRPKSSSSGSRENSVTRASFHRPQELNANNAEDGDEQQVTEHISTTKSEEILSQKEEQVRNEIPSDERNCSRCGESLKGKTKFLLDCYNLYYHADCFRCHKCDAPFGDNGEGMSLLVINQRVHCNTCYKKVQDV